jgi:hemerythrin-like metal-binding protein
MAYMEWLPALEVGFGPIDRDHRTLVDALNQLHAASDQGKDREEIEKVLVFLRDYTVTHFTTEESLMIRHQYPGAADHFAAHSDLLIQLSDLLADFRSGEAVVTATVLAFLESWLMEHILGKDRALSGFLRSRGAGA